MRKILGLALAATLLMSVSAFAVDRHLTMIAESATFAPGSAPSTTNNNDSCDIGVTPAATLLLPYFEVETTSRSTTTLFTVTNTSRWPQIAHVTLWTDWSYPVLDFNIFLTGYDVQPINLYDVIVSGIVAPPSGTSVTTVPGTALAPLVGSTPNNNTSNPNFVSGFAAACSSLPGSLPASLVSGVQQALTTGNPGTTYCVGNSPAVTAIGGNHGTRAIGYLTVDVSAACSTHLPTDTTYYSGTDGILYDNTLIGDYQQLAPSPAGSAGTGFDAGGDTMVHIRAIPEGGPAGTLVATNLPFTFYNRYNANNSDRRQPLPSAWAARYIQGGSPVLSTNYKIWREGLTTGACTNIVENSALNITALVRFDEHENSTGFGTGIICSPCGPGGLPTLPETSSTATTSSTFPPLVSGDVGGWMFLNLSDGGLSGAGAAGNAMTASRAGFSAPAAFPGAFAVGSRTTSQNWVLISMFGDVGASRLSVDFSAAWLGNGCSPALASGATIGPLSQAGVGSLVGAPLICPTGAVCPAGTQPPVPTP